MVMRNNYKLWAVVLLFFIGYGSINAQCGNQLLLNTWQQKGPSGNGNWIVAPDGLSVLQTLNGNPTFFVSPDSLINTTIRGSFEVTTTGDDDFIGFVFGYRQPTANQQLTTGTDFYLFDWKQGNQSGASEGFRLAEVNGAPANGDFWTYNDPAFTLLGTNYGGSLGWADNTLYQFELTYTDSSITILIDSDTIFDVSGSFHNGAFGFYNYSQNYVRYYNFTDNACPVAVNDSANLVEYGATSVPVLNNDTDADVANVLGIHSIFTNPSHGMASISGDVIVYIPNAGYSGEDSLHYILSDGVGGQDTATVFLDVKDVTGPHALDLSGNSVFASIPDADDLDFLATDNLTLEMWIRSTTSVSGTQMLLVKGASAAFAVGMHDGQVFASLDGGVDSAASTGTYDDGEWHHLAVVVDRLSGMQIYVDGQADGSDNSLSAGALSNAGNMIIGANAAGNAQFFDGFIDEVRVWKAALSQTEVQAFMHQRIPKNIPLWDKLMAYYQLDEGMGTDIFDYSKHSNRGAASSASWRSLSPANLSISGEDFVTEAFTYPYTATAGDPLSRIFNYQWSATNGSVASVGADSLGADVTWDAGQTSGSVGLGVSYSNWGGSESAAPQNVRINAPIVTNLSFDVCDGDSALIGGMWYKNDTLLSDTVALVSGLDSIYTASLNVLQVPVTNVNIDICAGDSVEIAGTYVKTNGSYTDTLSGSNGCDSILAINLQVHPAYNETANAEICEGQSIMLGGSLQTTAGVYTDSLSSAYGCDSVVTTTLVVHPIDSTSSSTTVLIGDSIFVGGAYQKTGGTYYDTFTGANGCDSVHATDVSFAPPARYFTYTGNSNYINSVVYPQVGDGYSTFDFEVTYYDTTGALPPFGFPRVILDYEGNGSYNNSKDRTIIMTEANAADTDPTDGKVYVASIGSLPIGMNYETLIQIIDGGNQTVFGPFDYPDVLAQPDLEIFANDISFSNPNPDTSSPLTVFATVTNTSDYPANNFVVHLVNQFDTSIVYPDIVVPSLAPRSSTTLSWNITTPNVDAWCPMQVFVDYTNVIVESNELDNSAIRPFTNGDYNVPGDIVIYPTVSPQSQCSAPYNRVGISGYAYYTGTAVPLKDSSVAGSEVTITRGGATYKGLTNSRGYFSLSIPAPAAPATYSFDLEVTDFTLTGDTTGTFEILSCPCSLPDLSASLNLSDYTIVVGNSITGEARITNIGCDTAAAHSMSFTQDGGTPQLTNQSVPPLAPGESFKYNLPSITFNSVGTYTICVEADTARVVPAEQSYGNNRNCRSVRVLPALPDIVPAGGPSSDQFLCNSSAPRFSVRNTGAVGTGSFDCRVIIRRNGSPVDTFYHTFGNISAFSSASFTAPYNYTATGSYTYELHCDTTVATGGQVAEVYETNNTANYGIQIKECKPDLRVVNCHNLQVKPVDPSAANPVTYQATVRNGGNDTAFAPIDVRFSVAGGAVVNTQILTDLYPGQSKLVQVNSSFVASGSTKLTVQVDPNDLINEFSNSNNSQNDNLCWEFQPVRKCGPYGVNFWERSYNIYQTAYLSVGVDVDHLYEASSVDVKFEVSGPGIAGTQNLGLATVNNLSKTCGCPYVAVLPTNFVFNQVGIYTFTMTVDPANNYPECNDGNNVMVRQVNVYQNLPDMRVLSQFINPDKLNPDLNEQVGLNITYENIGTSNLADQMKLKLTVDNQPLDSIYPVYGLITGDNITYNFPNVWSSNIPGAHIIRAIIDADEVVAELDELNNEATRAIIVGEAANLFFATFGVDNPVPSLGDTITLGGYVKNNGDVACSGDVEFAYIDNQQDTIPFGSVPVSVNPGDSAMVSIHWYVVDSSTTLIGDIQNTNVLEFLYNDNMATTQIGAFDVSTSATAGCAGRTNGSISVNVSGGTAPFTYNWSNGDNGPVLHAEPGAYELNLSDATGFTVVVKDTIDTIPGSLNALPLMSICSGDSALIFGEYRSNAGVYYDTLTAGGGCDSILRQVLVVNPAKIYQLPPFTRCDGDSALIFGEYRSVAGIYRDSLSTAEGCDSIVLRELQLIPATHTYLPTAHICDGDSVEVFGVYRKKAGSFTDTIPTAEYGCDSILHQEVMLHPTYTSNSTITICQGDSALIFGEYTTSAGIYSEFYETAYACDSVINVELVVKSSFASYDTVTVCTGDSVMIFGQYKSSAGVYSDTTALASGCDSIHSISLQLLPLSYGSDYRSICAGDSLYAGGGWQYGPGVFYDTLTGANGCDSILSTIVSLKTVGCDTAVVPAEGDSLVIVSDSDWWESTVVSTSNANTSNWPGMGGNLPPAASYTLPVVLGNRVNSVPGAKAINSGSGVHFFRKTFNLMVDSNVMVRIRSFMDDGMEVYINGKLVAREKDRSKHNRRGANHDLMYEADGTYQNGFMGGDPFDFVNAYRIDSLVHTGANEVVVALQNKNGGDVGGFSFRMDLQTNVPVVPELVESLVSDINWRKSTVATSTPRYLPAWAGVASLPAESTFTLPVHLEPLNDGMNIFEVDGSYPIVGDDDITYYRTSFTLSDSAGLNARFRTTFNEMLEIYVNGQMLLRTNDLDKNNRKLPGHDVLYSHNMAPLNGYSGGDTYDHVQNLVTNDIFRKGENSVIVVLRNGHGGRSGFSFRLDLDKNGNPVIVKKVDTTSARAMVKADLELILYPNPTTGMATVEVPPTKSEGIMVLRDMNGKLLWKETVPANGQVQLVPVDLSSFASGMYLLQWQLGSEYGSVKVVKR